MTMRRAGRWVAVAVLAAVLTACGDDGDGGDAAAGGDGAEETSSASTDAGPDETDDEGADMPQDETQDETQTAAVADLAEREGVEPGEIEVRSDHEVQWRSGAMGCPEPGGFYTQAITPGRQIVLALGDVEYVYTGAAEGPVAFCASPESPYAL